MTAPPFLYRHSGFGNLLATATNAVATYFVFRFAYRILGPSPVGIWAMIQGIMLISRLADGGSGGNVTRLVAIDRNLQGSVRLRNFVIVGSLLGTGPIVVLGLAILFPTYSYLESHYGTALPGAEIFALTVYSLLFGILTSANTILAGCLDGLGLMALRGYLACVANLLFVGIGYFLIRELGVPGLGAAYVIYALLTATIFFLALALLRATPRPDYQEQSIRTIARKTLHFNMSYFLLSICQLLMDPICKILIGRFSTLETVAIFDLANKVTSQARIIYQAIAQSILPLVSREHAVLDPDLHANLLQRNKFISRCSFYTMGAVVLLSGHLAIFTLGHVQSNFIGDVIILALANALNTVGLIGYYVEVGSGHLGRLLGVFIGMAAANVILSVGLGLVIGAPGVVLGYGCSLAVAGLACARALIPGLMKVFYWIATQAALELLLFAANCLTIWFTMIWLNYSDPFLCTSLILGMLTVTAAVFFLRERAELGAHFNRLTGKYRAS